MATAPMKSRANLSVGSLPWLAEERLNAASIVQQEVEEFTFSARNELEWLNEHMAEIFSNTDFEVADVFKTPGKLRGRTPWTARKRDVGFARAPLSDIFAPNPQAPGSPARQSPAIKQPPSFKVAEDLNDDHIASSKTYQFSMGTGKENDSGYHGLTEDESDGARQQHPFQAHDFMKPSAVDAHMTIQKSPVDLLQSQTVETQSIESTKGSASAAENAGQGPTPVRDQDLARPPIAHRISLSAPSQPALIPDGMAARYSHQFSVSTELAKDLDKVLSETERGRPECRVSRRSSRRRSSDSVDSSPERPIVKKKSSINFAALPAREPLASKKSVGARESRVSHVKQYKTDNSSQDYQRVNTASTGHHTDADEQDHVGAEEYQEQQNINEYEEGDETISIPHSEAAQLHYKTSTQRLQEQLALLGKPSSPRLSKSIPSTLAAVRASQPATILDNSRTVAPGAGAREVDENEDDWIGPVKQHALANDSVIMHSSDGLTKAIDSPVTYPALRELETDEAEDKKAADGPLSASKAKLSSLLKSARGIFASSAGASAQAKLEVLSTSSQKPEKGELATRTEHAMAGMATMANEGAQDMHNAKNRIQPRRSSSRLAQKTADSPATSLPSEALQTTQESENECPHEQTQVEQSQKANMSATRLPGTSHNLGTASSKQATKLQASGEPRRPGKPPGDSASKARPAPVSIVVQSRRMGQGPPANQLPGQSVQDMSLTTTASRQPTLSKKASTSSLQTSSSTQSFKTASVTRPKALEAAARKKEQDELQARRKADQKREMERRRAAKAEEERRAQEQRAAEQQRLQEAKQAAQRAAVEQKKLETAKKADQAAVAFQQSRAENPPSRPISRMDHEPEVIRVPAPHMNPAKPAKRLFDPETSGLPERQLPRPQAPGDESPRPTKKRRTSETAVVEAPTRAPMPPPVRPSMMKKDPPAKFTHGYMSSTVPAPGAPSLLKTAISSQMGTQHPKTPHINDLAKYSNARIPFSEAPNPPSTAHSQQQHQQYRNQLKTPGTGAKSSPHYPNGENIELPEIATDSEDEDDRDSFVAPSWADSPALRELLQEQQLVDPLQVFGPIAPLVMEDIFKGNKDRQAKFRARTSSANWNGADRLTEEERRRDFAARQRLEREGAWTYTPSG